MGDLSEHFSRHELACHQCGDKLILDFDLLDGLGALRVLANAPITILSGYRCPKHNTAMGGAKDSQHLLGKAVDLVIQGKNLNEMYQLAIQVPVFEQGGIGLYDGGFIHVDVRGHKARWARVKGKYVKMEALLS